MFKTHVCTDLHTNKYLTCISKVNILGSCLLSAQGDIGPDGPAGQKGEKGMQVSCISTFSLDMQCSIYTSRGILYMYRSHGI